MKPGIYQHMEAKKYHAEDGVSSTYLRALLECPAKALLKVEQTRPMFLSECLHTATLEPKRWEVSCVQWGSDEYPEIKGPGCVAKRQAIIDAHPEDYFVTQDEKTDIEHWRRGILAHPLAGQLVKQSVHCELSYFWEMCGIKCKARVDLVGEEDNADIKCIKDASPAKWLWYVKDHRLDIQQAWYDIGTADDPEKRMHQLAAGESPYPFHFIVVEKTTGICAVHYVSQKAITEAAKIIIQLIELHKVCTASKVWRGYESTTADVKFVNDMRDEDDDE